MARTPQNNPGDLYLTNGTIYAGSPWKNPVQSIAVKNGHVIALGDAATEHLSGYFEDQTIDLDGRVVLPGFIDSHIHLTSLGESLSQLAFHEDSDIGQIQKMVQTEVAHKTPGEWITGGKWSRHTLGGFPDKQCLDEVAPDNPVALYSKDLHSLLVNSAGLRTLGIDSNTTAPAGGAIVTDGQGEPTGILQETAMQIFENNRPKPSLEQLFEYHTTAAEYCYQYGITAVHSIESMDSWSALTRFYNEGNIALRTGVLLPVEHLDQIIEQGIRSGQGDDWLWTIGIKIFTDGALGSNSAWMKEPYEGSEDCGMPLTDPETLESQVRQAHNHHLSLGIHAIGDAAINMTLSALQSESAEKLFDRIEHLQVVDPEDLQRLPKNFTAAVQPIHLFGDRKPAEQFWGDRARYAYAFDTVHRQGTRLCFGSDAPVEEANPWQGIQAAVARRQHATESPWYPEEKISLNQALTAYTAHGAETAYRGNRLGMLRENTPGDLVVLNANPWEAAETDLGEIQPALTVINGNIVYRDGTF